ncbi:MAG TPA: radical SAM protein [Candidatus Limnocylindrales bacterium]|nr:radical SAM protein [Candidatus Limnocylindrales bacterium]
MPFGDDSASDGGMRAQPLFYHRVLFLICPTGAFCREDRCQSYFSPELIPSMRPPMEECEAAGAIRHAGAEPFVVDAPALGLSAAQTFESIERIGPDLVVLVATFGTLDDDLAWAARIRERHPDLSIGLRGAPCYVLAEEILTRQPAVDFCVRGEYELVFESIVRCGFRDACGTVYRDGDRIVSPHPSAVAEDLDALPWPDRTVIDSSIYQVRGLGAPQATVRVQRGCPFPCTYCLVHSVSGDRARHRSPASVAAEMAAVQRTGIDYFYLRADTFSLDRAWAIATSEAIAEQCPGARWVTTTRVECVDDAVLAAMRRGGCYGVSFGIDVGSRAIGQKVRKMPDAKRATAAMRGCDAHGIVSLGYVMIGFLWDTPETLDETERFLRVVRPDLLTIHHAHPYPGTRYYDDVMAEKVSIASPRAQAEPALASHTLAPGELSRRARAMMLRHFARPAVIASLARKSVGLASDRWLRRWPRGSEKRARRPWRAASATDSTR